MGHAIKINNVNFSNVAVDHISYFEPVPCTGISLDANILTFDTVEEIKSLTATVMPSNTTDTIIWESSNPSVATVSSSGQVTIHGIGSATITATCGNHFASASITQATIIPQYGTKIAQGYSIDIANNVIKSGASDTQNIIAQNYDETHEGLHIRYGYAIGGVEMVRVPYGATKACIATTNDTAVSVSFGFIADTENLTTLDNKVFPTAVAKETWVNTSTGLSCAYGQCVGFSVTNEQLPTLDYIYFK